MLGSWITGSPELGHFCKAWLLVWMVWSASRIARRLGHRICREDAVVWATASTVWWSVQRSPKRNELFRGADSRRSAVEL